MARVEVRGGPGDGLRVRDAGTWRWLDPATGRGFARPAAGRVLYRREDGGYLFAGHRAGHCEGCGAFVEHGDDERRRRKCPLCGGRVAAADQGGIRA